MGIFKLLHEIANSRFNKGSLMLSELMYRVCLLSEKQRETSLIKLTFIYEITQQYEKGVKLLESRLSENSSYTLKFQFAYFKSLLEFDDIAIFNFETLLYKSNVDEASSDCQLLNNLIYLYNKKAEYDKSLEIINTYVINKLPDITDKFLLINIGNTFFDIEEFHNAIFYYEMAVADDFVDSYQALYSIGLCYYKQGQYEQALAFYERALEKNIDIGRILYAVGCVYQELEDNEKARKHFRESLDNGYIKAKDALNELEEKTY